METCREFIYLCVTLIYDNKKIGEQKIIHLLCNKTNKQHSRQSGQSTHLSVQFKIKFNLKILISQQQTKHISNLNNLQRAHSKLRIVSGTKYIQRTIRIEFN